VKRQGKRKTKTLARKERHMDSDYIALWALGQEAKVGEPFGIVSTTEQREGPY